LLGIEQTLLPQSFEDGEQLLESVRQRQWAPSAAGRELAAALLQMIHEYFTREIQLLNGLAPTLIRHLAGDHCADILGLPPSNWTASFVLAFREVTDVIDIDDRQTIIERSLGALAQAWMRRLTNAERTYKSATFRVPDSLRVELEAPRSHG
jgi:hypothetical protein